MAETAIKQKAIKPEEKYEKVNVVKGSKTESRGEVTGHRSLVAYDCWYCGAVNWVDTDAVLFWCWDCSRLNRVP